MSWKHQLVWHGDRSELQDGETTVGRSRTCDLQVSDPSVSRRHVIVIPDGERLLVRDLGSSNGTFVNGQKLEGEIHVTDGTALRLGDAELGVMIEMERPAAAPSSAATASPTPPAAEATPAGSETRRLSPEDMAALRASAGAGSPDTGPADPGPADPGPASPEPAETAPKAAMPAIGGATTALSADQLGALRADAEAQALDQPAAEPATLAEPPLPSPPVEMGAATTAITPEQMAALQDGALSLEAAGQRPSVQPPPIPPSDSEASFADLSPGASPSPAPAAAPPPIPVAESSPEPDREVIDLDAQSPTFEPEGLEVPSFEVEPLEETRFVRPEIDVPGLDVPGLDGPGLDGPSFGAPDSASGPMGEASVSDAPPPPLPPAHDEPVSESVRQVGDASEVGDSALLDLSSVALPLEVPPPVFGESDPSSGDVAAFDSVEPPAVDSFDRPSVAPDALPASDSPAFEPLAFEPPTTFDQPMPPAAPPPGMATSYAPYPEEPPAESTPQPEAPARESDELLPSLPDIDSALGVGPGGADPVYGPASTPAGSPSAAAGASVATPSMAAPSAGGSSAGMAVQGASVAGFFPRAIAYLLDVALIAGVGFLAETLLADPYIASAIVSALGLVILVGGWAIWGTTPGKRALHLYVHGPDGEAGIGFLRALLRLVGYAISGSLLLIGFLLILFRKDRRGLHDLMAGTTVQRHG